MHENFPNVGREMSIQMHEVQMSQNRLKVKRTTIKHLIIKLSKDKPKEKNFKTAQQIVIYHIQRNLHKNINRYLSGNLAVEVDDIFKVLMGK